MVPFVQKAPLVAQEFLPFLELALSFVDPIHDAAKLVLAADEVRLPLLELTEGLLPRFELSSKRIDPTSQGGLPGLEFVLLQAQDVPVGVLHGHKALFELQDVLLLEEQLFDLTLQLVPLPDFEWVRRGLETFDPTPGAANQRVHLREASFPSLEHAIERLREFPQGVLHLAVPPARFEERGGFGAALRTVVRADLSAASLRLLSAQLQDPTQVFFFWRTVGG